MDVAKIIEDLYEGTLDPVAWDRAILGVADAVRASGAMLFAFNPSNQSVLRDENHRVDPQTVRDYARHWTYEDDRLKFFLDVPAGQPVTEDSLAIPDLERSPIYNEFLLPVDLPHFMPIWLHKSQEKAVALSLLGSSARGAFEPHDIETIRRLLPHLTRAGDPRSARSRGSPRRQFRQSPGYNHFWRHRLKRQNENSRDQRRGIGNFAGRPRASAR